MMPRLQASEQLDAIRVGSIAGGNMEKQARTDAIRTLQRRANDGSQTGSQPARRATVQDMAGMGIGVRLAAPATEASGG